jgi:hypothetical protein
MSDLFSIYEDSLNIHLRNISKILSIIKNLSKEKTENALEEIQNNINEVNKIIQQMEDEIKNKSDIEKSKYKTKIRNYKYELENNKIEFEKFEEKHINQKCKDAIIILENFENRNTENNTPKNDKKKEKSLLENEVTEDLIFDDCEDYIPKKKEIEMISISSENNIGNSRNYFREEDEEEEIINFKFEKNCCIKLLDLIKFWLSKPFKKKLKCISIFLLIIFMIIIIKIKK